SDLRRFAAHRALHSFPTRRSSDLSIIGLGRIGNKDLAEELLRIPVPQSFQAPEFGTEGPHATPNSEIIPAHLAVRSLVRLGDVRSEEHTSELQSRENLVCRLLLEK